MTTLTSQWTVQLPKLSKSHVPGLVFQSCGTVNFLKSALPTPRGLRATFDTVGDRALHSCGGLGAVATSARFKNVPGSAISDKDSVTKGCNSPPSQKDSADFIAPSQESRSHSIELITPSRSRISTNIYGRDLLPERSSLGEHGTFSWISSGIELSSNFITQISQLFRTDSRTVKMAVAASLLGLQVCCQAWAVPEVAQIDLKSSFDLGDLSDIQSGFASAFLLIFFSEIGDKTFFIAALLATRKSGVVVFSGTFGALAIMTLISVFLGRLFHYIDGVLPSFGDTKLPVDDIAAVILLVYFGVSTLLDAASMEESNAGEEQQEAELAIAGVGAGGAMVGTVAATFALVFVAEWGDKSFFSTIALAAASSPLGVVTGTIAGHAAATLLAVLGGSFLGNYVSEKVIAYIGGTLFLVFAGVTLVEILN